MHMPFYWVWMDCSVSFVPQFLNIFDFVNFVLLPNSLLLLFLNFRNFLFPYSAVFPAGAFEFMT